MLQLLAGFEDGSILAALEPDGHAKRKASHELTNVSHANAVKRAESNSSSNPQMYALSVRDSVSCVLIWIFADKCFFALVPCRTRC